MRSKHTIIDFPVFSGYVVHVEVTSDLKKSMSQYSQTKNVSLDGNERGMSIHCVNESFSFIFLHYNCSVNEEVHECWHVVRRMMNHLGVGLDSETVAYHLGYLTGKVHKFVRGEK
jgi:hypothetical protein